MKERIEEKINEIVEYILAKPEAEITPEEYGILANERRELQSREDNKERCKRMLDMVANTFPSGT